MKDTKDDALTHRGSCRGCGQSREQCDKRIMAYPKRCCPACKDTGPALNHDDE